MCDLKLAFPSVMLALLVGRRGQDKQNSKNSHVHLTGGFGKRVYKKIFDTIPL
jgi:hypothetical protein